MKQNISSTLAMQDFGEMLAKKLPSGSVIELIGDVGAGKTTLVKGIGEGLGVQETIQSPSYTIFCKYKGHEKDLHHYDFYRLQDPGLVGFDFEESLNTKNTVTVVEWGDSIKGILPEKYITIRITPTSEDERQIDIEGIEL